MKNRDLIKKVIKEECEALRECGGMLDANIDKAVAAISALAGKLIISGIGKSGLIAQKIASTFSSTGTPALFLHPAEAGHGELGLIKKGDLVFLISFSGEQREFGYFYSYCSKNGIGIISLTANRNSTLFKRSDIPVLLPLKKELSVMDYVPTLSSVLTLALGDAIAIAVAKTKKFTPEDFGALHPGGSLGQVLNMKVNEVMHRGKEIPFLKKTDKLKDILYAVSSHRLGLGIVADNGKKLLGVITDGDIRRIFEKYGRDAFEMTAGKIMTKRPKTAEQAMSLKEAVRIMEDGKITVLPVLSFRNGSVCGVIHMHDILSGGF